MRFPHRNRKLPVVVALGGLLFVTCAVADHATPGDWLNRMGQAVQTANYEGTVIRSRDGEVEVLKVIRVIADGVIREKVIVQEGDGLEIIRNGNQVQCILPDKKSVLVEEWSDQSTLFSSLPSSDIHFGSEYDVSIVSSERVAGRRAVVLAIRPHDDFRYGHRIWLDAETGFPLQTRLIGAGGDPVEQVKFADIRFDGEFQASALAPSVSTEDFRWYTNSGGTIVHPVETSWRCNNLPPGFRIVSAHQERFPGSDGPVIHLLYSDGLANVSVFIEPATEPKPVHKSRIGASSSYSVQAGQYRVTAVGDVPAATVEQIAASIQPNP